MVDDGRMLAGQQLPFILHISQVEGVGQHLPNSVLAPQAVLILSISIPGLGIDVATGLTSVDLVVPGSISKRETSIATTTITTRPIIILFQGNPL